MAIAPRIACLLLLAGVAQGVGAEKVYRWVDAQGKVHYSDQPKGNARPVDIKPGSGAGSGVSPPVPTETQAAVRKAVDCAKQRTQLDTYRQAQRIVETDALGNEREYSSEQRDQLIQRTEASLRQSCGSQS